MIISFSSCNEIFTAQGSNHLSSKANSVIAPLCLGFFLWYNSEAVFDSFIMQRITEKLNTVSISIKTFMNFFSAKYGMSDLSRSKKAFMVGISNYLVTNILFNRVNFFKDKKKIIYVLALFINLSNMSDLSAEQSKVDIRRKNSICRNFEMHGQKVYKALPTISRERSYFLNSDQHLKDLVSLIWYIFGIVRSKGVSFDEGTIVVEDKDDLIFNFLHSYKGTYDRSGMKSSHYRENVNPKFGIDIPKDKRLILTFPNNMLHLHFGQLRKGFIFLKVEQHGIHYWSDYFNHSIDYIKYVLRGLIPGANDKENLRQELVPHSILKEWKSLVYLHQKQSLLEKMWDLFALNLIWDIRPIMVKKAEKYGISWMWLHIDSINDSRVSHLKIAKNEFWKKLSRFDKQLIRKGNEIILGVKDFQNYNPPVALT